VVLSGDRRPVFVHVLVGILVLEVLVQHLSHVHECVSIRVECIHEVHLEFFSQDEVAADGLEFLQGEHLVEQFLTVLVVLER